MSYKKETIIKLAKKVTYKDVANYLGVTEQTVKQYPKSKRELFKLGLWLKKSLEEKKS